MHRGKTDEQILENVRLAAGCGAESTMLLAVAVASMGGAGVREGIDRLARLADDIAQLEEQTERPHKQLATLDPELSLSPEVARMRPDLDDHEVRGRLLFGELLGKRSFFQIAALAIAGLELDRSDGELLGELGAVTQLADPRIWPLTVTRRVASHGGTLAASVVAGLATLCTEQMTVLPVAGFMRFLDRMTSRIESGTGIGEALADILSQGERIPGVGRPVLRSDERVPRKLEVAARYGRDRGPSVELTRRIDEELGRLKGLRVNSAGFQAALLRDLGFSPDAAAAFCLLYFLVPLLTHATAGHAWRSSRQEAPRGISRRDPEPRAV